MGYFSNGTEGEMYFDQYCARCAHEKGSDNPYCPVWDVHLWLAYKVCGTGNEGEDILNALIPRSEDRLSNERCTMFIPRESVVSDEAVAKLDAATKPESAS